MDDRFETLKSLPLSPPFGFAHYGLFPPHISHGPAAVERGDIE